MVNALSPLPLLLMIQLGVYNSLKVLRETINGLYLTDEEGNEVLLPKKYTEGMALDEEVKVFVYRDSQDRIIATTEEPFIQLHQFALLTVRDVAPFGAFLAWGLEKDLLVPSGEQKERMKVGRSYLVYMYLDEKSDRLVASSRLNKFLDNKELTVAEKDEVDVMIWEQTDLGVNVIINNRHKGLIYQNELFQNVAPGDVYKGYIKRIREDNKLDVLLEREGYKKVMPNADKILERLAESGGFLPLTDKSDPQEIQRVLEMSKKTFKQAVGALYKQRKIELEPDGIRLKS